MQSATSDVNAAVVALRTHLLNGKSMSNIDQVRHAIYVLNEILPDEFRIIFDTEYYEKSICSTYKIGCTCGTELEVSDHTIKYQATSNVLGMWVNEFSGTDARQYVECLDCQNHVFINDAELILEKKSMFTDEYVPEEPVFTTLYDRVLNQTTFWKWALICHATLERKYCLFRNSFSTAGDKLI